MRNIKSIPVSLKLKKYPYITAYAQHGLVNLTGLARLLASGKNFPAVGMELRRYIAKLPKKSLHPIDFSKYNLQLITRTHIHEIILTKNQENRKHCLQLVGGISQTKYFVSLVEGEKEIVVMTDHPVQDLLDTNMSKKIVTTITEDLGFISVNFPITMRNILGVYSLITSGLAEANIPIHSFHTIGGEILILVTNKDLARAQDVLQALLSP